MTQVELYDLCHPQFAQVFAGALDRNLGGFLPGRRASADHFDNFIDALRLGVSPREVPWAATSGWTALQIPEGGGGVTIPEASRG
jgi:hypothetical protein